jgi:hypothetical protein
MALKVPVGAEAAFQLVDTDEFGFSFSVHLYGAGRRGWFLACRRMPGHDADTGRQPLGKGEWRTFLNFVKQARFWELAEEWPRPWPDDSVEGGEWLDLAGREGERYHRIHRFIWREPGLDAVLAFCRRASGLFVQHPVSGFWGAPPDARGGRRIRRPRRTRRSSRPATRLTAPRVFPLSPA